MNPVLPGSQQCTAATRQARERCSGQPQQRRDRDAAAQRFPEQKAGCLRAHVIRLHIKGPCSLLEAPTSSQQPGAPGAACESPSVEAPGYQAPFPSGLSWEGACVFRA